MPVTNLVAKSKTFTQPALLCHLPLKTMVLSSNASVNLRHVSKTMILRFSERA